MYNKITNPLTGRKVNIDSKLGKKILACYIYQSGGANFCSFNEKTKRCYKSNKADPKGRCIYSRKTKRCKKNPKYTYATQPIGHRKTTISYSCSTIS